MNVVPTMIKIFMPSSRVVNPPGALGSSMLEGTTLGFTPSLVVIDSDMGLIFTSAVT